MGLFDFFKKKPSEPKLEETFHENGKIKERYYYKYNDKIPKNKVTKWWDKRNICGPFKIWHDNGNLEMEINFKEEERDGVLKTWYKNGQLSSKINFKGGMSYQFNNEKIRELVYYKDGMSKEWHENGKLKGEANYANGKEEGISKNWYDNGKLLEESTWCDGKLDGITKQWHKNGQLKTEKVFKHSKQVGEYKIFHENGKLAEEGTYKIFLQEYVDTLKKGIKTEIVLTEFNEISRLIVTCAWITAKGGTNTYLHRFLPNLALFDTPSENSPFTGTFGYKHGIVKKYDRKGKLAEEILYDKGEKVHNDEIKWEEIFYDSGKIKERYQYLYEKNFKHGLYEFFYNDEKNTKKEDCRYILNKKEGVEKHYQYYGNKAIGKVKYEFHYKNDELNGLLRFWDEKGQLTTEENYMNGKQMGISKRWSNKKLILEEYYEYGQQIGSYTRWHRNGKIAEEGTYELFTEDDGSSRSYQHGITKYYNENGKLNYELNFNKGDDGIEFPNWVEYYRGEVRKKFEKDLWEFLKKNKEEIIKLKKENDWDDLDTTAVFYQEMDIYSLLDEVLDVGIKKYAEKYDNKYDEIMDNWSGDEAWIELEEDSHRVLYNFWNDLNIKTGKANKS